MSRGQIANPYDPAGLQAPAVGFELPKNIFRFGEAPLWSTHLLPGGDTIANSTFRVFTAGRGMVSQGYSNALTIAETNLKEGGRIPAGVAFSVYGIAAQVMFSGSTADAGDFNDPAASSDRIGDLLNLQNNMCLSWDFLQTKIDIAPLSLVGAGGGTGGAVAAADGGVTPAALSTIGNLSNGFGGCWMYRKYPTELPAQSTFAVELQVGSRAAAVSTNSAAVRVVLLGYYKNIIEIG